MKTDSSQQELPGKLYGELDPLHYLVSEAIEYSMAAFDLMKQEDESETETSTADTLMDLEICKTAVSDVPVEILFRKYWREDHHYKISGVFGIKFQLRKLLKQKQYLGGAIRIKC
ncbi:hypothetical protein D5086_032645 [Populus alba]|uniref:Uncharacterized protein n=1 Tax=Populus alba TaxID=43335 RepID=A0ACC4AEM4_POPAL